MKTPEKDGSVIPGPSPANGFSAQAAGFCPGSSQPCVDIQRRHQHPWHSTARQRLTRRCSPCRLCPAICLLQGHHTHCFRLSSLPLPFLSASLQLGLKCHGCCPMQVVGPAEHRPATAEPTPDLAAILASCGPLHVERARGGAAHGKENTKGTVSQAGTVLLCSLVSQLPEAAAPQTTDSPLTSWPRARLCQQGSRGGCRLGESEGTCSFSFASCSGLCLRSISSSPGSSR